MNNYTKRTIKVVSVIAVFLVIQSVFSWALKPINYSHWINRDIKTYKKDVDTIVLGSSRVFCGFDPKLFDEKTGCFSFALGSASQGIKDSYYYLLNCKREFPKLKNVVIDVYFVSLIKKTHSEGENLQRKIIMLDRFTNPVIKAEYILNSFDVDSLPMAFFNSIYYNNRKDSIVHNVKSKLDRGYRNYESENPNIAAPYLYRGYIPYDTTAKSDLTFPEETELNYVIDEEAVEYLNKIIAFCKSKGINLIFFQMPISNIANKSVKNYHDYFDEEIKKISKKNSIFYADLNDKKYKFSDDVHFTEAEHLNIKGAELATAYCAEVFLDSKAIINN